MIEYSGNAIGKDLQTGLEIKNTWERKAVGNSLVPKKGKISHSGRYCRVNWNFAGIRIAAPQNSALFRDRNLNQKGKECFLSHQTGA